MYIRICFLYIVYYMQNGWSPLHVASQTGFVDLVELLIESGTKANIQNKVAIRNVLDMQRLCYLQYCILLGCDEFLYSIQFDLRSFVDLAFT